MASERATPWPFPPSRATVNFTQFLGYAANLHLQQGTVTEGRVIVAQAFALMERSDERYFSAELHRVDGNYCKRPERAAKKQMRASAEPWLLRVNKARSRSSYVPRSAWDASRCEGKTDQGRTLVENVYASFRDDSDTPDRANARDLLEILKLS